MNALELRGLCKHYSTFSLDHLDLTLPCGCVMGLVGENGAGKSTTIKLILELVHKDSGTITVLGRDSTDQPALMKEDVGVVLDEVGLPGCLTARQAGQMFARIYRRWDADAFSGYLNRLDVPDSKPFKTLSRGTKMKLGIAAALSHGAKLLLLDEATSGLDPVVRDEVIDLLCDFTRDETHSVLMSSHIVSDLEKSCDYIAFLHKGRLLLCEEKDRLYEQYGILHCDAAMLARLQPDAIVGKRVSAYGVEALVKKNAAPAGCTLSPISIEELFIFMVKEVA